MAIVGILGLGLIGGSLALDLLGRHEVRGCDPDSRSRELAAQGGVTLCESARDAMQGADLLVLCAPLAKLPALVETIAGHWSAGMVVTDVGGVKGPVVSAGRLHLPDGAFVGGHPMAGSTERGFAAARKGLFEGSPWALTATGAAQQAAAARVREILEPTRARFLELDPLAHDQAVAFTSHLPYVLSVALARAAQGAQREGVAAIADLVGPGFRDATRLAMTGGQLGHDMVFENREALLLAVSGLRHQLAQAEILLQGEMGSAFLAWTESAALWRSAL